MRNQTYFASEEYYSQKFLDGCLDKINRYRQFCTASGKTSKWYRALRNYYGISTDGNKSSNITTRGGENAQIVMGKVNDYRNLIQNQLTLITQQRPAGEAKAINSNPSSLHQARIASSLVEYYLTQAGLEQRFVTGVEYMQVVDEAFYILDWNTTLGDPVRPMADEQGQATDNMLMTGDIELKVIPPWYMARDVYMDSPDSMKWGIYNFRINKYDLAEKFPNKRDEILNTANNSKVSDYTFNMYRDNDSDMITVFCLSHWKTPTVKEGRWSLFVNDACLIDGPYPYTEFNLYRIAQNNVLGTAFGYTNNNDLLQLEECTDAIHSAIMTNQVTYGMNAVISAKGSGLQYSQIGKGPVFFEVDPQYVDKIKPLQLTATAPELFKYQEWLGTKKEQLSGINSVVRGDPSGALKSNSGSALALISSQALQFNSGAQRSYYQALSKVNTGLIKMLRQFAASERVIQITGKVQAQYLNEFKYSGDDLDSISSVVFHLVDPISKSPGGAVAIADNLLEKGMVKNAHQYINVVRTGSLDAFTEDDEADQTGIKAENERLREGRPVKVIITENHQDHIMSHMSLLAAPEAKEDAELVITTLQHIEEHSDTWQWLSMFNPAILIATKQQVLPASPQAPMPTQALMEQLPQASQMQMAPPMNEPQGPVPAGANGGGGINLEKALGPDVPVQTEAKKVNQPNMPKIAGTNQRAPMPMNQAA